MKAVPIIATLVMVSATSSFAQESPLECGIRKVWVGPGVWSTDIECSVTEDNVYLESVQLNRGRCEYRDLSKSLGKTYHFGDKFTISAGWETHCNLLEFSISANGETWTWKVNN
jgi:hypothetical protein